MSGLQPPPDLGTTIQQMAQQAITALTALLTTINSTVIEISRLAYISVILVGLLLWATHLDRRLGKDLIKGGVVLAILSELVFPQLNRI